jgi:transcriptional regulator with XRE-family HTH domain
MLDSLSIMKDNAVHDQIARRVRALRAAQGLSLEALATHCGVSRSMLSLIERGESSPTAVVLDKLATGLGVPLASLFAAPQPAGEPVSRRADQVAWRDPHSGYVRRNVSPAAAASPTQIVDVSFPPHARVAYESPATQPPVLQQVWMLEGTMEITHGETTYTLRAGDCFAMSLDQPNSFHNPSGETARYAVILTTTARS